MNNIDKEQTTDLVRNHNEQIVKKIVPILQQPYRLFHLVDARFAIGANAQ